MGNETTVQEETLENAQVTLPAGTSEPGKLIPAKESKWNKIRFINRDMLKYMALFLMGGGHLIIYIGIQHFIDWMPLWLLRLFIYGEMFTPPVFFFFISEGFRYTRSRKKYALRLLVLALITQIPYYFCHFFQSEPLWYIFLNWNVIVTLLAGITVLMVWESKWKLPVRIIVMILITGATALIQSEWAVAGPILIFMFYMTGKKPVLRFILYTVAMFAYSFFVNGFYWPYATSTWCYLIAEMCSIVVITFFYNGRKGHFPAFSKWAFYVFYPLHLVVAVVVKMLIG